MMPKRKNFPPAGSFKSLAYRSSVRERLVSGIGTNAGSVNDQVPDSILRFVQVFAPGPAQPWPKSLAPDGYLAAASWDFRWRDHLVPFREASRASRRCGGITTARGCSPRALSQASTSETL